MTLPCLVYNTQYIILPWNSHITSLPNQINNQMSNLKAVLMHF